MKFRPSAKLSKKYFFAIFTTLGIQAVFGINCANAICDDEIRIYCSEVLKLNYGAEEKLCDGRKDEEINDLVEVFKDGRKSYPSDQAYINYQLVEVLEPSYKRLMAVNKPMGRARNNFQLCVLNHTLGNSSSGSSNQPIKKANRQATTSQSNQTSSNKPKPDPTGQMGDILGGVSETKASSNSNDLSKMTSNQLIDIATEAENSGDYARAYLAELQLSKSPDPKVSRQGLRQVSFRLRTGQGVAINRSESHRLAMQAANLGDVTAHSYVCADYLNGKGVEENHRKALDYCLFAAEKGDMKAQGNLGWLYESGEGVQHNPSLSNEWTCKAAAQGEPTALNNVKKAKINCN